MGNEINIDSIRALEKWIEEGQGDVIKLKRTRNSLLNISTRVPPETLGSILAWTLVRKIDHSLNSPSHFDGLRKGSYNFLLVCHHWFQVASCTPELWSFWGNTLGDWKKRYHRSGSAPLDLVLDWGGGNVENLFKGPLSDAVRSRVMQGSIRQVHLRAHNGVTLAPIISSLTPDAEGSRNENIESIVLRNVLYPHLDVSSFFARSRLSRLRLLHLSGNILFSSWGHLASGTTLLTTLSLSIVSFSPRPPPTTSQLLSILVSNPSLRELSMSRRVIPEDDDDGLTSQVPLCHLKKLDLRGDLRSVFRLLDRLSLPGTLDSTSLAVLNSTVEDVSQIFGPYLRGYFRRDCRLQERLGIDYYTPTNCFSIRFNALDTLHSGNPSQGESPSFVTLQADLHTLTPDVLDNLCLDLIAFTQERVLCLNTDLPTNRMEDLLVAMPNIKTLHLSRVALSKGFLQPNPDGPRANTKLLPSLRSLHLENVTLSDNDWSHLTTYLAHQTSDNQAISVQAWGRPYMPTEVADEMEGLVEEFSYHRGWRGENDEEEDETDGDYEEDETDGDSEEDETDGYSEEDGTDGDSEEDETDGDYEGGETDEGWVVTGAGQPLAGLMSGGAFVL